MCGLVYHKIKLTSRNNTGAMDVSSEGLRRLMIDNDFSEFERPEYYIRYIEPIEAELRVQVEYDMDEQGRRPVIATGQNTYRPDQAWLDVINEERRKEQSGPITYETFEILMDKLEKEWFELVS